MARRLRRIFNPTLSFVTEQPAVVKKEFEALISQFQKLFTDIEDNFQNLDAGVGVEEGPNIRVELNPEETIATVSAWRSHDLTFADSPFTLVSTNDATAFKVDASGGDVTITLDPAADHLDKLLWFKKTDATLNTVTIIADAGDAAGIEQLPAVQLTAQYDSVFIYSNSVDGWLNVTCCPLDPGVLPSVVCSSDALKTMPTAAAPISITPSGSAGVPSAWSELTPSTATAWVLAGLTYNNGVGDAAFTVEIGIGGAGSEVPIGGTDGYLTGMAKTAGDSSAATMLFGAPWREVIPQGVRVAARIITSLTDVTPWTCKALYYEAPVSNIATTDAASSFYLGFVTIGPSASAWANSGWVQVTAAAAAGLSLVGMAYSTTGTGIEFEIDVGIGGSGSETVLTTYRGQIAAALHTLAGGPARIGDMMPVFAIPDGERIACRVRTSGSGVLPNFLPAPLFMADIALPTRTSDTAISWAPAAANSVAVTSGAPGSFGSWVQVLAATADDCCIVGAAISLNASPTSQGDLEIGIGAAASEVGIGLLTFAAGINTVGEKTTLTLTIPRNVATGQRLAVRYRGPNTTAVLVALGYVLNPSFTWRSDENQSVYPLNSSVSVNGNASAWANSAWGELIASTSGDVMVTGMTMDFASGGVDLEVDLGIGGGGAESVIYTYSNRMASLSGVGVSYWPFPAPLCVADQSRISFRVRKSGTNTSAIKCWITYVPE